MTYRDINGGEVNMRGILTDDGYFFLETVEGVFTDGDLQLTLDPVMTVGLVDEEFGPAYQLITDVELDERVRERAAEILKTIAEAT